MLALDTSALIKRYIEEPHSDWLVEAMAGDPDWAASMLIACEAPVVVARSIESVPDLGAVDQRLTADLDRFRFVPVDADCLVNADSVARAFTLRTLDAIHLAAARRLPEECRFITFDRSQAKAAGALGLDVLVPPEL
jgi:predicted nucleic acid-binding protein